MHVSLFRVALLLLTYSCMSHCLEDTISSAAVKEWESALKTQEPKGQAYHPEGGIVGSSKKPKRGAPAGGNTRPNCQC